MFVCLLTSLVLVVDDWKTYLYFSSQFIPHLRTVCSFDKKDLLFDKRADGPNLLFFLYILALTYSTFVAIVRWDNPPIRQSWRYQEAWSCTSCYGCIGPACLFRVCVFLSPEFWIAKPSIMTSFLYCLRSQTSSWVRGSKRDPEGPWKFHFHTHTHPPHPSPPLWIQAVPARFY